jgi:hypothetical protein
MEETLTVEREEKKNVAKAESETEIELENAKKLSTKKMIVSLSKPCCPGTTERA